MADEKTPQPKIGEQTGRQDPLTASYGGMFSGNLLAGNPAGQFTSPLSTFAGGSGADAGFSAGFTGPASALVGTGTFEGTNKYSSPIQGGTFGFGSIPGIGQPLPGTFFNYRIMSAHPTLALAMGAFMLPCIGAAFSYKATKYAPKDAREFIENAIEPIRHKLVWDCLKGTSFGFAPFERIYKSVGGMILPDKFKPLLPELTMVRVDDKGRFAGLTNQGVELDPANVFWYTFDGDGDNYYGRSRMENCRRAWSNWLMVEDNLARLGFKTASIIPKVMYPPASGLDEQGKPQSNFNIAKSAAIGMSHGKAVVVPNLAGLQLEELGNFPELAGKSMWDFSTIDMGNPGPAMTVLMAQLAYYDKLLVRGWLRAERSLLEAQTGGSRADSDSHTDIGLSDSSRVLDDMVRCFNSHIVDDLLALNYGEEYRGTVMIEPAPLVDTDRSVDEAILAGIAGNLPLLAKMLGEMDMQSWMKRRGIPIKEEIDPNEDGWDKVPTGPQAPVGPDGKPPIPGAAKNKPDDEKAMLSMMDAWEAGEVVEL